jgi:hypothetical protein
MPDGDPDGYQRRGWKGLQASPKSPFCWPLLIFLHAPATWVLSFVCMELAETLVYLQVMFWAFT